MNESSNSQPPEPQGRGVSGKPVVIVMLIVGLVGGFVLSRNMPRRNPKLSEPGTPYYSPPNEDEIQAMREAEKKKAAGQK